MATQEGEEEEGGELLYCATESWGSVPTRLAPLKGVHIVFVASGSASSHCLAIAADGRCFTWGQNEKGQLGHGDVKNKDIPTPVQGLAKYKVIKAGAGRQHTVVITDAGSSFAFGFNKHGQLGCGYVKDDVEKLPVKSLVTDATYVCCGADFTLWLSSVDGASILTAGLPQYGQLGHGTDNAYNVKKGSAKLAYEAQSRPTPIAAFAEKRITKAACGDNHTVATDSNGFVYTWGCGGYGRLGHKEEKDEWTPKLVKVFQRQNVLSPTAVVAAGAACSACTAGGGQLYMWGRVKATADNWMYPKPLTDLNGWTIRSMDSGNTISMVAAENSCISWGTAFSGELGYGPSGPKSSANPKKIDSLEGMRVKSVACGRAHSIMIVSRSKSGAERLDEFDVYEGRTAPKVNVNEEAEGEEEEPEAEPEPRGVWKRNLPRKQQQFAETRSLNSHGANVKTGKSRPQITKGNKFSLKTLDSASLREIDKINASASDVKYFTLLIQVVSCNKGRYILYNADMPSAVGEKDCMADLLQDARVFIRDLVLEQYLLPAPPIAKATGRHCATGEIRGLRSLDKEQTALARELDGLDSNVTNFVVYVPLHRRKIVRSEKVTINASVPPVLEDLPQDVRDRLERLSPEDIDNEIDEMLSVPMKMVDDPILSFMSASNSRVFEVDFTLRSDGHWKPFIV